MSKTTSNPSENMTRANKLTVVWSGEGAEVAVARFYKTHTKLVEVKSDNPVVTKAGFKMPESTDQNPVTPQQKLETFKTFMAMNAGIVGIHYDAVDRRADEYKLPSKMDEEQFKEHSVRYAQMAIQKIVDKVRDNVIGKMITAGNIPADTTIDFGIDEEGTIEISESFPNGGLKYATATYMVVIQVENKENGTKDIKDNIKVELASGQLRKPRSMVNTSLTQTAIKNALTEAGCLPTIEKKSKKKDSEEQGDTAKDTGMDAEQSGDQ